MKNNNVEQRKRKPLGRGVRKLGINIVDSPMGFGKTSWAIQEMKNNKKQNYIYITPFLDEIQRIKNTVKERKFVEPKVNGKAKTKLDSFKQLILKDKNIASTHSLFSMADEELITLIKSHNYTLILDEVMNVVHQADNIKQDDITTLFEGNYIKISDTEYNRVEWIGDNNYNGRYNDIKMLCEAETLYYVNNKLMVWAMPISTFTAFDEVYVLTYQFDCQIQKYYYDYFGVDYKYFHIENINDKYILKETKEDEMDTYDIEFRRKAKELITILDNEKMNSIGKENYDLSKSWFEKEGNKRSVEQLKKNTINYFTKIVGSSSQDNMWTCFKEYIPNLKGKGYTKGWIPLNSRATNEFANKKSLAYLCNRFLNPYVESFFNIRNISINEDKYAVSELLQWIWRSQIRNGEPINLYIPSSRMRNLLEDFLNI